jgi:hypothetical protein
VKPRRKATRPKANDGRPPEIRSALERQNRLSSQAAALGTQFILTELDLALTFCATAESSPEADKRERNLEHARQAFESANYFLSKRSIPNERDVKERLAELGAALERLEGKVAAEGREAPIDGNQGEARR